MPRCIGGGCVGGCVGGCGCVCVRARHAGDVWKLL